MSNLDQIKRIMSTHGLNTDNYSYESISSGLAYNIIGMFTGLKYHSITPAKTGWLIRKELERISTGSKSMDELIKDHVKTIKPIAKETSVYDDGKLPVTDIWDWLDEEFLLEMTEVMKAGAEKYEKDNWRLGTSFSKRLNSAQRHLIKFLRGKDNDKELGTNHLAMVAINCMMVYHWLKSGKGVDDRDAK